MSYSIYGLRDPRTREIRYIGKTVRPNRRLWEHIEAARRGDNIHSSRWIKGLLNENLKPEMSIIESGLSEQAANEREQWWIAHGGFNLTNMTNGGDGGWSKGSKSEKHRKHIADSKRGKPFPHKGIPRSDECRDKISRVQTGKHHPHKGVSRPHAEDTKSRISDSLKKWWAAKSRKDK